jgi:hypothetical protein
MSIGRDSRRRQYSEHNNEGCGSFRHESDVCWWQLGHGGEQCGYITLNGWRIDEFQATNAAGSVVSTVTDAANTDTSNGGVAPTAAPVLAGGLLGAGVAMVAML